MGHISVPFLELPPLKARQPNPSWLRNSWPEVDLLQGNSGHPQGNFGEISADQMALSKRCPLKKVAVHQICWIWVFHIVFHSYTFYTRITRMSVLEWPKVKVSKTFWPWNLGSQIPRPGPRTPLIKCPSPLWKKNRASAKKQLIKQPSSYHHDRYYRCLNPYLWSLNPHVWPCLVAQPTIFHGQILHPPLPQRPPPRSPHPPRSERSPRNSSALYHIIYVRNM